MYTNSSFYVFIFKLFFRCNLLHRELLLTQKLLNHGFLVVKLKSSLPTFHGRHRDVSRHHDVSRYEYLCLFKNDHGCSLCRNLNPVLFLFMTYRRVCNKRNTTGTTSGTGTAYSSKGYARFTVEFLFLNL